MTSAASPRVLVVGPSPAIQNTLVFSSFTPTGVNRATEHYVDFSGKGPNTARAAAQLGGTATLVTVLDHSRWDWCHEQARLSDFELHAVRLAEPMRICTTLLGETSIHGTELVQEMPGMTAAEAAEFSSLAEEAVTALGADDFLICTGSLPAGLPRDLYPRLARLAPCPVLVDAHSAMLRAAISAGVAWLKPNRTEWAELWEAPNASDDELVALAREHAPGARLMLTDGGNDALYITADDAQRVAPPQIDVKNPIGSGDAVSAGIVVGAQAGREGADLLRYALACGSANCENVRPGFFTADRVAALLAK